MSTETAMVVQNDEEKGMLATLSEDRKDIMFCSMNASTPEEKKVLFKAMNNPEHRLGEFINKKIMVKDIFAEVVECFNEMTGEITEAPRIVLIDDKGKGYQCVSKGVLSAMKKLFMTYGMPTWSTPIGLEVKQISKGEKKILTFDIA